MRLDFNRSGTRLLVPSSNRIHIVDHSGRTPVVQVMQSAIREVAGVGDEVWVVAGDTALHRYDLTGAPIAAPTQLPGGGGRGRLHPLRGPHTAAVWTAIESTMLVADGPRVTSAPVPGDNPDLALPVTTDRWVVCRRDRVTLRGTSSQRWSASLAGSGLVVDGAILFDGRGVGLLVQSGSDAAPRYQLVIAGLHEPVVHHRITLSGVEVVRFAPSRGFALLAVARRLLLVDLRFGRVIKEHDLEHAITDIAIDDAAQHIALRTGDNIEHLSMTALLSAASRRATVEEEVAGAPLAPPAEEDAAPAEEAPAPEPAPQDFHRNSVPLESADALTPRPRFEPTTRGESLALLDRYRDLVVALVGRAIALAWDQGRLTFPADGGLPYRTEVAGLLGRTDGIARGDVESAERFVAEALAAVRAAESATGERRSPLEAIAREFELSTMGRLILLVVAAPSLWGETARLYGILANDEHRPLCDELLVHHVLGPQTNRHDIARELDRDGPLIRYGLVRAGEGRIRPFLSLSVDPILARLFRGADATRDPDDIRIVTADKSFDDLLVPGATKDKVARLVSVPTSTPNRIVVRGRIGSGRHTLLAILGAVAGRKLGVIDATAMVRDLRGRGEQLRAAMRRAHLLGLLPCIDGLEAIGSEDQITREGVRELLRHHPGPLAVRLPWDAEPPLDPGHILVDLPALSVVQRIACWKHTLGASGLAVNDPEELALRYRVGPGVITRVCSQVATERTEKQPERSPDGELDVAARIDHAIRQHLDSRLTATATRVQRLSTWSQVVLPPETLESLLELIARIKHRRKVFETWGYERIISTSRGVTALFQGGPGTGKTMVASAIANDLGMDLYRVDLSRVMSKWIGETEQNLARLFDAAEDGHAIVLFDEADSLFAKRTEIRTSVDRYANLEVNYLLQRLDSFDGIAILTTNFGTSIDGAFKRRLSFRLTFPFPDEEMRELLWKAHVPTEVPTAGEFQFAELARRYRLSGGYIRNASLRAAFLAAEEQSPLTQDHLERAIRAEFREIGKLAESGVLE